MSENKINIAVLLGDPSGIGPELVSKLLSEEITNKANVIIIGEKNILESGNKVSGKSHNLEFVDKEENKKKSHFEIIFATIIKVNDEVKEKKELEKIILCDVQVEIYPDLEKSFLNLINNSGYPGIKFEKKVDFEKLYNQRFN